MTCLNTCDDFKWSFLGYPAIPIRHTCTLKILASVPMRTSEHVLQNKTDLFEAQSGRQARKSKCRQCFCKICSAFSPIKTKSFKRSFYRHQCLVTWGGYVPLCNTARREETCNRFTCYQIWHRIWVKGTAIATYLRRWLQKAQTR